MRVGFVNHPEDPGGTTNLGITKCMMQECLGRVVSIGKMKALTQEDVKPIYKYCIPTRYALRIYLQASIGRCWIGQSIAEQAGQRKIYRRLFALNRMVP